MLKSLNENILSKINVSRETLKKVDSYLELLKKYNKVINLTGDIYREDKFNKHILSCFDIIERISSPIYDIGSGNGIPGIILSIAGFRTILVERDMRKSIVLGEMIRELGLNSEVINKDYRDVRFENIVVSKGLLDCDDSVEIMRNNSNLQKIILFKGKNYQQETNKHLQNSEFLFNIIKSKLSDETNFVEITKNIC